MKNRMIILLLFVVLGTVDFASAQGSFGLKGGANLTNISGDFGGFSSKTTFNVGIFMGGKIGENTGMQFEILYSQQGAKSGSTDFKLNYINLPLLFKVYVDDLNFQFGPQIGILADAKTDIASLNDGISDFDGSFVLGFGFEGASNITMDCRYNIGFTNIIQDDVWSLSNRVLQLSVGIKF